MLGPAIKSFFSAVLLAIAAFLTSVVAARELGVQAMGAYAAVLLVSGLASGIAQFGLGPSFVYFYRRHPSSRSRKHVIQAAAFVAVVSIAFAVALAWLSQTTIHGFGGGTVLISIGAAILLLAAGMSQIEDRLTSFNAIRLALPCSLLFVLVLLDLNGGLNLARVVTIQGVLAAGLGVAALGWVLTMLVQSSTSDPHAWEFPDLLRLGLKFHAVTCLGLVAAHIDKIALLLGSTSAALGVYSVAFAASRILVLVPESVSSALFSTHAGRQNDNLAASVLVAFRGTFYPLLALAGLFALVSEPLVVWTFGDEFKAAAVPFAILCLESVFGGASWLLAQYFNAGGRPGMVVLRQAAAVVPMICLLPLIPMEDPVAWLAALLLLGSLTRFAVTIALLNHDKAIRLAQLLPSRNDVRLVISQLVALQRKHRRR